MYTECKQELQGMPGYTGGIKHSREKDYCIHSTCYSTSVTLQDDEQLLPANTGIAVNLTGHDSEMHRVSDVKP